MTEPANDAAARVAAFLPELTDLPGESPATQLGAARFAADVHAVLRALRAERDEARALARDFRTAYHDEHPGDDLSLLLPDWLTAVPELAEPDLSGEPSGAGVPPSADNPGTVTTHVGAP